jgi:predicted transcriptional regulator
MAAPKLAPPKKVRFTLELTEDVNGFLDDVAEHAGTTKSEVLRKAVALLKASEIAKQKGRELAVIDPKSEKVVGHLVGL